MVGETIAIEKLRTFAQTLPEGPCESIAAEREAMHRVNRGLITTGLGHLVYFGEAYVGVTDGAELAYEQGVVSEPEILTESVVEFGDMWFEQLRILCGGDLRDMDPAWALLIIGCANRRMAIGSLTLAGMNCHVRRDLPRLVAKGKMNNNYFENDYMKLIGRKIREVADASAYQVPNIFGMRAPAITGTDMTIQYWRKQAYFDGNKLKFALENQAAAAVTNNVQQQTAANLEVTNIKDAIDKKAFRTAKIICRGGEVAAPFLPQRFLQQAA